MCAASFSSFHRDMATMDSLLALERTHAILITLALAVAAYFLVTPKVRPLPNIPWVGKSSRLPGADTWATLASFFNRRKWFAEGYQKVSLAVTSSRKAHF